MQYLYFKVTLAILDISLLVLKALREQFVMMMATMMQMGNGVPMHQHAKEFCAYLLIAIPQMAALDARTTTTKEVYARESIQSKNQSRSKYPLITNNSTTEHVNRCVEQF